MVSLFWNDGNAAVRRATVMLRVLPFGGSGKDHNVLLSVSGAWTWVSNPYYSLWMVYPTPSMFY